jgi:uncharacterized protein YqgC (DUF456 family)
MPEWLNFSITAIVQVFLLVGLFGLIVPLFPGIFVMWLSILGYGVVVGFSTLGIVLFVLITILGIAGALVDNVLMGVGAHRAGASWWTIAAAFVAGVLGTFLFPPIGGIIAAPLVVLLLEYRRWGEWEKAWQALKGLAVGWGLSFVARFFIGLLMMALWWLWVWKG